MSISLMIVKKIPKNKEISVNVNSVAAGVVHNIIIYFFLIQHSCWMVLMS